MFGSQPFSVFPALCNFRGFVTTSQSMIDWIEYIINMEVLKSWVWHTSTANEKLKSCHFSWWASVSAGDAHQFSRQRVGARKSGCSWASTVEAQQGSGKSRHASTDDFTRLLDLHAGLLRPEMQSAMVKLALEAFIYQYLPGAMKSS